MNNVIEMSHPLIKHKISLLRDKNTGTNEFRKLIEEIGILMGYEALRDLPLEDVEVETPIETCMTPMISGKKLAIVPILRAGLGMVNGILALVPSAKVGHIGLYRDEETFTAVPNTGGQTTTLYAVWSRDGSFQVDNVTDDTSMFEGCDNLVGGNGTTYDYSHIDSKEANIDIPSDRGYFTAK